MENEIKRLIELNNEQLRTKGKLLQEIIDLKKQIIQQDKNIELITTLQTQNTKLNTEIVDHLLHKSALSGEVEELKKHLSLTEMQKQNALIEIDRLSKLKWHQRIFRKM